MKGDILEGIFRSTLKFTVKYGLSDYEIFLLIKSDKWPLTCWYFVSLVWAFLRKGSLEVYRTPGPRAISRARQRWTVESRTDSGCGGDDFRAGALAKSRGTDMAAVSPRWPFAEKWAVRLVNKLRGSYYRSLCLIITQFHGFKKNPCLNFTCIPNLPKLTLIVPCYHNALLSSFLLPPHM